jgi:23S rRNA (cytidine1920-2'-O)/16S rRNA (cytidine1409-2'-O)-methyltransferase
MRKRSYIRLDALLVNRGLADALSLAQAMVMAGEVIVNEQRVDKPGSKVPSDAMIRLKDEGRFVSRGGDKLDAAIADLEIPAQFKDKTILDIGASTGGFTDCLLSHGAKYVIALDVGTAQLAWKLRMDPRVESLEQTDIKSFISKTPESIDWVVADLSFTSLAKHIPDIQRVAPNAKILLLIKPQFELPRAKIPSGGVVTNESDRMAALDQVKSALVTAGYEILGHADAKIPGRQGNREIFIYASPNANSSGIKL